MASCPIELWFVRHGESKNNAIMSAASGLGTILYPIKFSQDPYITEKGISVASDNGQRLIDANAKFDLVFTSSMVRTMETSYYMFIKTKVIDKVYVAPFISELPLNFGGLPIYENIPLGRVEQIKMLGKNHGSDLLDHIDWSLVGGPTGENKETLPPSGDNFLKWMYTLPMVQELLRQKEGEKLKIAVVTHSHFLMEKDTLHLEKKPDNADLWIANLCVLTSTKNEAEKILTLTDLRGWYRQEIATQRDIVDQQIEHTNHRAEKKHDKYTAKIEKLSSAGDESDDEKDEEKRAKKIEKYLGKLEKKHTKYNERKDLLEQQKNLLVNLSDIEIEQHRKQLLALQLAEESA
jgi:broad specificity phosphatase PhoE